MPHRPLTTEAELRAAGDVSVYGLLARASAGHPRYKALVYLGRSVTYEAFLAAADRAAGALAAAGVGPGDQIVICAPNIPEAVILIYGANKLGAVCRLLHPHCSEAEVFEAVERSRARLVFAMDEFCAKFDGAGHETLIRISAAQWLGPAGRAARALTKPGRAAARTISWGRFIKQGRAASAPAAAIADRGKGEDIAFILSSGGTGGAPKSIELSNLSVNVLALQVQTFDTVSGPNNTAVCLLPIFHGFGLALNLMAALIAGKRCVLLPQYSGRSFARALKRYRPEYIAGVPLLFEKMASNKRLARADLSFFKLMLCGGDTMSVASYERVDAFLKSHGCAATLRMGYGLTECVSACSFLHEGAYTAGCIGYPLPGMFISICDPESGVEMPAGTVGEICVAGPTLMSGYDGDPEATARALRTHPDGRLWLHTGDLGEAGEGGVLYFRGRMKNMIKAAGYNVFPAQVEEAISRHPAVKAVAVAGRDDGASGTEIVAYVVAALSPDKKSASGAELEADIIKFCSRSLSAWSVPRRVVFVGSLPMTRMKKVDTAGLHG